MQVLPGPCSGACATGAAAACSRAGWRLPPAAAERGLPPPLRYPFSIEVASLRQRGYHDFVARLWLFLFTASGGGPATAAFHCHPCHLPETEAAIARPATHYHQLENNVQALGTESSSDTRGALGSPGVLQRGPGQSAGSIPAGGRLQGATRQGRGAEQAPLAAGPKCLPGTRRAAAAAAVAFCRKLRDAAISWG